VQRIVDGRERQPDRGLDRFAVQLLGGDVPVTLLEQGSSRVEEGDATQTAHAREGTAFGQRIRRRQNGAELPASLRGSVVPSLKHHELIMSSTRISRCINAPRAAV
jgi:hypothetical protein